jgi:hypothetical protein
MMTDATTSAMAKGWGSRQNCGGGPSLAFFKKFARPQFLAAESECGEADSKKG